MICLVIFLIGIGLSALSFVLYQIFDLIDDYRGIYSDIWYNIADFCYHTIPVWFVMAIVIDIAIFMAYLGGWV